MTKIKILFTIQWYGIPAKYACSANALCDEILINELKANPALEIHTLSYGLNGFPMEEVVDGVHVHRFRRPRVWNMFIRSRGEQATFKSKLLYWYHHYAMRFRQIAFYWNYPDTEPMHNRHFAREAVKLHERLKFDVIISEFNGVDSVKAGAAIKKADVTVKFIPICWDSIAGGRLSRLMPRDKCLAKKRRLESEIMTLADKAIVMEASRNFHLEHSTTYEYWRKFSFLDVPYLKVKKEEAAADVVTTFDKKRPLRFLYSGTMGDRDAKPFLDVVNNLGHAAEFVCITPLKYHSRISVLNDAYKNVNIRCVPYMSHAELDKFQRSSDFLVNFGVSNANAVSGKIFDYMRLGKPIISTVNHDEEACIPYIERYAKGLIIDERKPVSENVAVVNDFIQRMEGCKVNMGDVCRDFYANTIDAYISELMSIIR